MRRKDTILEANAKVSQALINSCCSPARGLWPPSFHSPSIHDVAQNPGVSPKILIRCRIYFSPVGGFSTSRNNEAYSR